MMHEDECDVDLINKKMLSKSIEKTQSFSKGLTPYQYFNLGVR